MKNEMPGSLAERPAQLLNRSPRGLSLNRLLTLGVFVVMFAIFSIFATNFFTVRSVLNLLVQTCTVTILSIGSALVLIVGGIDFSLGVVIALSGTAAAWFAGMGIPIWISMLAAAGLGGITGLTNGFLIAKMRLPSFITTLAMAMFFYGILAFAASHARWLPVPDALGNLANVPVFRIYAHDAAGARIAVFPGISWIVLIMVFVAALFHLILTKTRIGRHTFLVGSNQVAARFSGIKVVRVKITAYVLAGLLAGLVGVLLASRMVARPGAAAGYEIVGIECAMIGGASLSGGVGSVGGTVIGSFILSTLGMGLTMMNTSKIYIPLLLNGVILICAVYLDQIRIRK
jgi:ribose transport system permease protein